MVLGSAFLLMTGGIIIDNLSQMLVSSLTIERSLLMDTGRLPNVLLETLVEGILSVMPFLLLTLALALATPALIGGWLFSTKAVASNLTNLTHFRASSACLVLKPLWNWSKP